MKRTDVENVLVKMGVPANLLGFDYIVEAVLLVDSDTKYKRNFVSLYEDIAKKHESTYQRVERCIRNAFTVTRDIGDIDVVSQYIGYMACANKSSVFALHRSIKNEISQSKNPNSNSERLNEQQTIIKKAIEILSSKIDYDMAKVIVEIASKQKKESDKNG